MLLSPGAIGAVSEVLDASDFYRDSHAKIYRAGLALYAKGEPVDAITIVDELEERGELEGVGGRVRLHELAALVPATANAAHYARIVREMATLRGLIAAGQQIAQLGWERPGETQMLVDRAEQVVFDLSQSRVSTEFSHIEELLKESFERITALYEAGADVTGAPSGFRDLDRLTSGFQPGNLIIVAARPSMGKSALGLCVAANLALRNDIPVALFTLEMSKSEVTQRLLCSEAKVESQRLRNGKLAQDDWPRLVAAGDKLMKAPIYVDDTGSITMMEIRSKARRLKTREPKLGLIIVDYLQLMTSGTTAENRVQEVSQISRNLKVLARDLDVPILAMSQLSRAVEQRHDKRPILSDLRESGSIEQDADLVMFVYRDEYYNEDSDQQGLAEIILSKHRNGPTGIEKLSFLKRYAKFADLGRRRSGVVGGPHRAGRLDLAARHRFHGRVRALRRARRGVPVRAGNAVARPRARHDLVPARTRASHRARRPLAHGDQHGGEDAVEGDDRGTLTAREAAAEAEGDGHDRHQDHPAGREDLDAGRRAKAEDEPWNAEPDQDVRVVRVECLADAGRSPAVAREPHGRDEVRNARERSEHECSEDEVRDVPPIAEGLRRRDHPVGTADDSSERRQDDQSVVARGRWRELVAPCISLFLLDCCTQRCRQPRAGAFVQRSENDVRNEEEQRQDESDETGQHAERHQCADDGDEHRDASGQDQSMTVDSHRPGNEG